MLFERILSFSLHYLELAKYVRNLQRRPKQNYCLFGVLPIRKV